MDLHDVRMIEFLQKFNLFLDQLYCLLAKLKFPIDLDCLELVSVEIPALADLV